MSLGRFFFQLFHRLNLQEKITLTLKKLGGQLDPSSLMVFPKTYFTENDIKGKALFLCECYHYLKL